MKLQRPRTYDIPDPAHRSWTENIFKMFNRNVSYGTGVDTADQNIDGKMVDVPSTGVINTTFSVAHNLGRIPKFYDIKYKSIACDIFDAGTAWTTTQIFLKCNQANAHVILFIH